MTSPSLDCAITSISIDTHNIQHSSNSAERWLTIHDQIHTWCQKHCLSTEFNGNASTMRSIWLNMKLFSRSAVEEVLFSVRAAVQQVQRSIPRLLRRRSSVSSPRATVSFH